MKSTNKETNLKSAHLSSVLAKVIDYRGQSVPKSESGIPLITARNVREGNLDFSISEFVEESAYDKWMIRGVPEAGDVLFTTEAPLGKVAIFPSKGCFALGQRVVAMRPKEGILDSGYLLQFLLSPIGQKRIDLFATGSTAKGISSGALHKLVIDYPSLVSQKKISTILLEWDLVIEKTERLIVAKEKWFTSLTQELIHNCTEGLQHVHLRDICEPVTRKNSINELNVLTTSAQHGLISQMDYYKKSVSAEDVRGYYLLKKGEFAYNRSSSNGYPYGAIKRLDGYPQGVLSTLYLCFSLKNDAPCDSDFMAHAFEAGLLNKQLVGVCQEGARSHGLLNITKTDFFGLKIFLPAIAEQRKIAAILNTARQEIDLMKKQAEAFRRQKRGLMQKLLTGEWRVNSTEEAKS